MKRNLFFTAIIIFITGILSSINGQINAGISIGDRGLRSFYLSVGNYYHVPQREVIIVHERRIPDEEIPVVFYIARNSHVSPREIADYRLRGYSWWEVSCHFGLGSDIYGRREVVQGPPYGNAWGHYKHNKHSDRYTNIYLSDNDIIGYVNNRVIRESYGCSDNDIHRMRNQGYNYVSLHDRYYSQRNGNDDRYERKGNDDRYDNRYDRNGDDDLYERKGNGKYKGNHGRGRG